MYLRGKCFISRLEFIKKKKRKKELHPLLYYIKFFILVDKVEYLMFVGTILVLFI